MQISFVAPHRLAGAEPHSSVLLAFSGGADSRALLHLLAEDAKREGYPLLLAHVHHGIRGDEALRDRAFCQRMAKAYGLELYILDADVPRLAKEHGRSLEEEARAVRYDYFASLMQEKKISLLATAHHADDHLETLLFRLSRGTTSKGMGGIAPCRPFATGCLVRPLLRATRREILAFCESEGLEYVTDSTNGDTAYARNKLRAQVVPVLEELFDAPQARALEFSVMARQDEEFLEDCTKQFSNVHVNASGIALQPLRQAPPALQRRVVTSYLWEGMQASPEQVHVRKILEQVSVGHNGARCSLPNGWDVVIEESRVRLRRASEEPSLPSTFAVVPGETVIPGTEYSIFVEKLEKSTKVHNLSTAQYIILNFDFDIIDKSVYWRLRREGDTIRQGGMTRRLRKLYNQRQIPLRVRERLPLLCDEIGILWAPLVGGRDELPPVSPENRYQITLKRSEDCLRGESEG